MTVTETPKPFDPAQGYEISVSAGTPPYTFTAEPSPPNPPGVVVDVIGDKAFVTVPPNTPPGTVVTVKVSDTGTQPTTVASTNRVQ